MRRILLLISSLTLLIACSVLSSHAQAYKVTNLFSDGSVPATTMDANFLNPWGISVSSTWWISTANSGFNYVISSATNTSPFKVAVAPGTVSSKTGVPTGSVTTSGASGLLLSNGAKAQFLFSTLDGTVSGWNSGLGTSTPTTLIAINNASANASYPGLALLNVNSTTSYLLVPNFGAGSDIEVYDQNFKPAKLTGSFTDPNLPSGYSPWSIHILNNQIWVAYAQRPAGPPYAPIAGPGEGLIDIFDNNGNFVTRAITGGNLNAPWGVAFAPSTGFGVFSGDLLVGNFGDGKINAYDPKTYAYIGQLMDSTGKSLVYGSLWDLLTGGTPVSGGTTPSSGGSNTTVYFTAGLANEAHGLFGAITSATVAGAAPALGLSSAVGILNVNAGSSAQTMLSIVPVNGLSGAVTLSCTNLPPGAACVFTPSSVNVASNAVASAQLTVTTTGMTQMGRLGDRPLHRSNGRSAFVLSLASLLPFSLFLLRRRLNLRERISLFIPVLALTLCAGVFMVGCGGSDTIPPTPTPVSQTQFTVNATGPSSAQQSTNITLAVH